MSVSVAGREDEGEQEALIQAPSVHLCEGKWPSAEGLLCYTHTHLGFCNESII